MTTQISPSHMGGVQGLGIEGSGEGLGLEVGFTQRSERLEAGSTPRANRCCGPAIKGLGAGAGSAGSGSGARPWPLRRDTGTQSPGTGHGPALRTLLLGGVARRLS